MRTIKDVLLIAGEAALAALLIFIAVNAAPEKDVANACSQEDFAHIPYADEYEFVCVGDTIEVWDAATGEYITSEQRCTAGEIRAEDGSCVPADYYEEGTQ